jgi:hypothetical protein
MGHLPTFLAAAAAVAGTAACFSFNSDGCTSSALPSVTVSAQVACTIWQEFGAVAAPAMPLPNLSVYDSEILPGQSAACDAQCAGRGCYFPDGYNVATVTPPVDAGSAGGEAEADAGASRLLVVCPTSTSPVTFECGRPPTCG